MAKKSASTVQKHPLMIDGKDWNRELVMDHLCDRIATSSKSMGTILLAGMDHEGKHWDLPNYSTVIRWLQDEKGGEALRNMYAHAREAQADFMADEMAELHEKAWIPVLGEDGMPVMSEGKIVRTVDKSSAAVVRLESDNKKWLMSKLRPKKYGEKIAMTDGDGNPLQAAAPVLNLTVKSK